MHLSESDIRHLADLARLHVSDDEAARLSHDLTEIIRFIDAAADVDGSDIQPMVSPSGPDGTIREDVEVSSDVGQSAGQAPNQEDGFVGVPPVRGLRRPMEPGDGAPE